MAIATGDPHVHHLLFDVATSSISMSRLNRRSSLRAEFASLVSSASCTDLTPHRTVTCHRDKVGRRSDNYVRLSEEEFRTIATTVAPYMR